jgi:hypothetical protein
MFLGRSSLVPIPSDALTHPAVLQLYMPPSGYVNSCDGGRSHTYCDYRQQ